MTKLRAKYNNSRTVFIAHLTPIIAKYKYYDNNNEVKTWSSSSSPF